jgi:hypothetical protein
MTDSLSKMSLEFDFDSEVFSSAVYHRMFRGTLKAHLRQQIYHSAGEGGSDGIGTDQQIGASLLVPPYEKIASNEALGNCSICGQSLSCMLRGEHILELQCGHMGHTICLYETCHRCPICGTVSVTVLPLSSKVRMSVEEWRDLSGTEEHWSSSNGRRHTQWRDPLEHPNNMSEFRREERPGSSFPVPLHPAERERLRKEVADIRETMQALEQTPISTDGLSSHPSNCVDHVTALPPELRSRPYTNVWREYSSCYAQEP